MAKMVITSLIGLSTSKVWFFSRHAVKSNERIQPYHVARMCFISVTSDIAKGKIELAGFGVWTIVKRADTPSPTLPCCDFL